MTSEPERERETRLSASPTRRSPWARYTTSVVIIAVIVASRAYVIPEWSLTPGIILAGWGGGFGAWPVLFVAIGFAISFLNEARLQAKLRAETVE